MCCVWCLSATTAGLEQDAEQFVDFDVAGPAFPGHSFGEFDRDRCTTLFGVQREIEKKRIDFARYIYYVCI